MGNIQEYSIKYCQPTKFVMDSNNVTRFIYSLVGSTYYKLMNQIFHHGWFGDFNQVILTWVDLQMKLPQKPPFEIKRPQTSLKPIVCVCVCVFFFSIYIRG